MSGNLYQLKTPARAGQHVVIDGPYDRFGIVMDERENGYHLIRGLGIAQPKNVIIFHATESKS